MMDAEEILSCAIIGVDVVIAELNRVRARIFVDRGDGNSRVTIRWTAPNRPPQLTVIEPTTTPQQARSEVRHRLMMLGLLTTGTDRRNVWGWHSDDPPLSPRPPLSPLQAAIDEIAHRVAQLSPFGRNPSAFASARSEIVAELRRLARTGASR